MYLLRNLVGKKKERRDTWVRSNIEDEKQTNKFVSTSQGFNLSKRRRERSQNNNQIHLSNYSPSPMALFKRQRDLTPDPLDSISNQINLKSREIRRSPFINKNMGHRMPVPAKITLEKKTVRQKIQAQIKNKEYDWKKNQSFKSKGSQISHHTINSFDKNDYNNEERLESNAFINIPKVKTNYNNGRMNGNGFINIPKVKSHYSNSKPPIKRKIKIYQNKNNSTLKTKPWLKVENKQRRARVNPILNSYNCLLYTSPSPRDLSTSRMPSSA